MVTSVFTEQIRYLVNEQGEPTDVLVDYKTWQSVMDVLELLEDWSTAQAYLERRKRSRSPEELGLERMPESLAEDGVYAGLD